MQLGGGGGEEQVGVAELGSKRKVEWLKRLLQLRKDREEQQRLLTIQRLRFGELSLFVSYRGDTRLNLESFDRIMFKVHPLVYTAMTVTYTGLGVQIRNDLIRDLLGQVHRNFNNIGTFIAQRLGVRDVGDEREEDAPPEEGAAADGEPPAEANAAAKRSMLLGGDPAKGKRHGGIGGFTWRGGRK